MNKILFSFILFLSTKSLSAQGNADTAVVSASFAIPECPSKAKNFCDGYLMLNKGMIPGGIFIITPGGKIVCRKQFPDFGVKVAKYSEDNTILALMGKEADPSSYGRRIAEYTLTGDTLMQIDFDTTLSKASPHHEILKTNKGNYLILVQEKRIFDLSRFGGSTQDTITGDGIMIVDKKGKTEWYWSVFDHLDPLKQPEIRKLKNDWVHANGISVDADGHFLISFLHLEQVWKVHSKTGRVMWKFGKKCDIRPDSTSSFEQTHSFHPVGKGQYLFFDNGVRNARSGIKAYSIKPEKKRATLDYSIPLPREAFSPRMGSVALIDDSLLLACASKANWVFLMDKAGNTLWKMKTGFNSYRAGFITDENFKKGLHKNK